MTTFYHIRAAGKRTEYNREPTGREKLGGTNLIFGFPGFIINRNGR
jgi:hypothetical protein